MPCPVSEFPFSTNAPTPRFALWELGIHLSLLLKDQGPPHTASLQFTLMEQLAAHPTSEATTQLVSSSWMSLLAPERVRHASLLVLRFFLRGGRSWSPHADDQGGLVSDTAWSGETGSEDPHRGL